MNKNVTKLWEQEFDIVKNGLSEEQVVTFVDGLISEKDTLTQRQKNLASLTKLAERTVTEAQNLAEEIKMEAASEAKSEVSKIIAEAETRAEQIFEEKATSIIGKATEQSGAIKAGAEREAELILRNQKARIQPELKRMAEGVFDQLLLNLESIKGQVVAMEQEFDPKLFPPTEEEGTTTAVKEPSASANGEQPAPDVLASVSAENNPIPTNGYEEKVELEFLPPADLLQILEIDRFLESLPEVQATEIIPIEDKPIITVFLRKSISLVDALGTLPEIRLVKEDTDGEFTGNGGDSQGEDSSRKILITLAGGAKADKARG